MHIHSWLLKNMCLFSCTARFPDNLPFWCIFLPTVLTNSDKCPCNVVDDSITHISTLVNNNIDDDCNNDDFSYFAFVSYVAVRDVPNIHFIFASVPNNVFIFGRIVSERVPVVSLYMYSAAIIGSNPQRLKVIRE